MLCSFVAVVRNFVEVKRLTVLVEESESKQLEVETKLAEKLTEKEEQIRKLTTDLREQQTRAAKYEELWRKERERAKESVAKSNKKVRTDMSERSAKGFLDRFFVSSWHRVSSVLSVRLTFAVEHVPAAMPRGATGGAGPEVKILLKKLHGRDETIRELQQAQPDRPAARQLQLDADDDEPLDAATQRFLQQSGVAG